MAIKYQQKRTEHRHDKVHELDLVKHLDAKALEGWTLVSAERRSDLPTHVESPFDVIMRREVEEQ